MAPVEPSKKERETLEEQWAHATPPLAPVKPPRAFCGCFCTLWQWLGISLLLYFFVPPLGLFLSLAIVPCMVLRLLASRRALCILLALFVGFSVFLVAFNQYTR